MPRAKQLTAWVPDQPGMLGEVGSALGAKKANILAFTAWAEGERGAIRMVVQRVRPTVDVRQHSHPETWATTMDWPELLNHLVNVHRESTEELDRLEGHGHGTADRRKNAEDRHRALHLEG